MSMNANTLDVNEVADLLLHMYDHLCDHYTTTLRFDAGDDAACDIIEKLYVEFRDKR
jgi:hypothetical protein